MKEQGTTTDDPVTAQICSRSNLIPHFVGMIPEIQRKLHEDRHLSLGLCDMKSDTCLWACDRGADGTGDGGDMSPPDS